MLKEKWEAFTANLKKEKREFEYNALIQEFTLEESEKIVLKLPNKSQKKAIESIKQDFLGYLRNELNNSFIDLECELIRQKEELVYTNKEKFEYLAKKYPELLELKQRMDLDTEF